MVGQLLQEAFGHEVFGRGGIGHVHDERVAHGSALGGKNGSNSAIVIGAGGQAIHRFGRQAEQAALGQNVCRLRDGGGVGCGK